MTRASEHLRGVGRAADEALATIGFRRRGMWGLYSRSVRPGVFAWLGLNTSHTGGPSGHDLEVNPYVGVRHDRVEALLAELRGRPEMSWSPSYVVQLGYLTPDARPRAWAAATVEMASREFVDMAAAVQRWGLPMAFANAEVEQLASTLAENRHGISHQNRRALVATYLLLDRPDDAERALGAIPRERLGGEALREHETFAANVRARLAGHRAHGHH